MRGAHLMATASAQAMQGGHPGAQGRWLCPCRSTHCFSAFSLTAHSRPTVRTPTSRVPIPQLRRLRLERSASHISPAGVDRATLECAPGAQPQSSLRSWSLCRAASTEAESPHAPPWTLPFTGDRVGAEGRRRWAEQLSEGKKHRTCPRNQTVMKKQRLGEVGLGRSFHFSVYD